jgi:prepilin-type N-terminal cleavage/methylation domain-containing protein
MVSRCDDKGFTLVENLVAITVLCIGFLAVAAIITSTMRGRCFSARATCATVLAQEKMEDVMRIGYSGLPSADETYTEAYGTIPHFPEYSRVVTVDATDPSVGMKTVTITVYWNSHRHDVRLETIVAE